MNDTMTLREFQELLVDSVAVAWFRLHKGVTEALLYDTFEELLEKLRESARVWTDTNIADFVAAGSEAMLWNLLRARLEADERPWGVLQFPRQSFFAALQWRDSLWRKSPQVVEFVEKTLPTLA